MSELSSENPSESRTTTGYRAFCERAVGAVEDSHRLIIALEPHKAAAVLEPVTKTVIESAWFTTRGDGYADRLDCWLVTQ